MMGRTFRTMSTQTLMPGHSRIGNRIPPGGAVFPGFGGISRFPIGRESGIGKRAVSRFGREPGIGVPIRRAGDFLVWANWVPRRSRAPSPEAAANLPQGGFFGCLRGGVGWACLTRGCLRVSCHQWHEQRATVAWGSCPDGLLRFQHRRQCHVRPDLYLELLQRGQPNIQLLSAPQISLMQAGTANAQCL